MNEAEILSMFQKALCEVVPGRDADWEALTLDTTIEEIAVDSVAFMELVSAVEERIDKVFPDDKLAQLSSFRDLAALVQA